MERKYQIYQVTSPDGMFYIGYTSMTLNARWRQHVRRAYTKEAWIHHPFYSRIRFFGQENFSIEAIDETNSLENAKALEIKHIAEVPKEQSMNLSPGGDNDAYEGGRLFWERINQDPERKNEYIHKLSEIKLANDWCDYDKLTKATLDWRKAHPREAYKLSHRAIRIATKAQGRVLGETKPDTRSLKERLMHKYKLSEIRSANAKKEWQEFTQEERTQIRQKISIGIKRANAKKSAEEKRQLTEKARSCIDRKKQGAAASRGIKQWWAELKADPVRYAAYIHARNETNRKKREAKQNENL